MLLFDLVSWYYLAAEDTPVETSASPNSIHSVEFMVLKHRADLLYSQRHYRGALELYQRVLTVVPESNTCVSREIRDAIARSQLKLGCGEQAKIEAERMVSLCCKPTLLPSLIVLKVLPPHDKDWSSWKLLAQCHEALQDYEGL